MTSVNTNAHKKRAVLAQGHPCAKLWYRAALQMQQTRVCMYSCNKINWSSVSSVRSKEFKLRKSHHEGDPERQQSQVWWAQVEGILRYL